MGANSPVWTSQLPEVGPASRPMSTTVQPSRRLVASPPFSSKLPLARGAGLPRGLTLTLAGAIPVDRLRPYRGDRPTRAWETAAMS